MNDLHAAPMLLRRARGIVAALLLLPLTILASVAHDTTAMVCRMTGAVSWAPCEPAGDQDAPEHAAFVEPSCCDFVTVARPRAPAETVGCPELSRPTLAASSPGAHLHAPSRGPADVVPLRAPAPRGLGPPIRQLTQTFLI